MTHALLLLAILVGVAVAQEGYLPGEELSPVNNIVGYEQEVTAVSIGNSTAWVFWKEGTAWDTYSLYGQLVHANGSLLGDVTVFDSTASTVYHQCSAVALPNGSKFLLWCHRVVWGGFSCGFPSYWDVPCRSQVFGKVYDANGTYLAPVTLPSANNITVSRRSAVAINATHWVVAYRYLSAGWDYVCLMLVRSDGTRGAPYCQNFYVPRFNERTMSIFLLAGGTLGLITEGYSDYVKMQRFQLSPSIATLGTTKTITYAGPNDNVYPDLYFPLGIADGVTTSTGDAAIFVPCPGTGVVAVCVQLMLANGTIPRLGQWNDTVLTLDLTFDALYADGVILPNGLLVGTWTNKGEYIDANDGVVGQLMRLNSSSFKWTK